MRPTRELIAEAGRLLYGERWQADLATAVDVTRRQVQRWRVGEAEPRRRVWSEIASLVDTRIGELRRMRSILAAQAREKARTTRT